MSIATTPRQFVHLPGYTFDGYGEAHLLPMFMANVGIDVYRKRGGITAEVRHAAAQGIAVHPDDPQKRHLLYTRDHGDSVVYVAVR